MHVDVDEAGHEHLARKVALDALRHGEVMAHLDDVSVANEDLAHLVKTHLGVDDAGVLKQ